MLPSHKILVVEDEALILFATANYLRDEGFEVVEALDADQAMTELAIANDFDGLVTDINMPGDIDGMELARFVKRYYPGLAVILTSGKALEEQLPEGVRFVSKPYRLNHLCSLLRAPVVRA